MMESGDTTLPSSPDSLEISARHLDKMMNTDSILSTLSDKLGNAASLGASGLSGLQDRDYPLASQTGGEAAALKQFTRVKRVPLPAELVEHFGHMQCNCNMGIFPQVSRAWLTIDSDIYLWRYEDGGDLAFFDGLTDTILNVCLVTPKPGILQSHIKYLLCLATPTEIVLLGVSFTTPQGAPCEELHLLPEPLFTLPCEQLVTKSLQGTGNGRIFMGGKDGQLYEFGYQSQQGWFGKKTQKINHSSGTLSWIMPSLLGFAEEDPILQIEVDNSRNILYTRSEKGTVTVYDMGLNGEGLEKVISLSAQKIFEDSSRVAATVETSNLKPIVHISPIQATEDDRLHLVALTGGGSRLYLSTRNATDNNPSPRPYCLRLVYIRLPPGFAPSGPTQKPTKVHNGYYNSGLTVLASSPAEAADVLWLIWNGSLTQSGNNMMETHSVVPVEGHTWALTEVTVQSKLMTLFRRSYNGREPPSVVVQHFADPRQIILLSAQGSIIVNILRPVDSLRQLLIDCGGADNDSVKCYFSLLGAEQATATALILATSQSLVDRQVAEWSAKAVLQYGGEPKLVYPAQYPTTVGFTGGPGGGQMTYQPAGFPASPGFQGSTTGYQMYQSPGGAGQYHVNQMNSPSFVSSPTSFNPNLISTPQVNTSNFGGGGYHHQQTVQQPGGPAGYHPLPDLHFSARHNGLYLYISRLLRPLWTQPLISGPGDKPSSVVTGAEVEFIINHLTSVKIFLEKNSNLIGSSGQEQMPVHIYTRDQMSGQAHLHQQRGQQDALLREKQSFLLIRQLVVHTLQVLGLWMVVVDHQVDQVLASLSNDNKNLFRQLLLRDIVVTSAGRDICVSLVQGLIQRYLGDSANTDAISNKLREVCPGLYRVEDAASSKAHELLLAAAQSNKPAERSRMIQEAVEIAKGIAGSLRLDVMVSHLTAVHAYKSVVEICLAAAAKKDPQGLAVHFYQHGENVDDSAGVSAYSARTEAYRHCTTMLDTLLSSSNNIQTSPSVPKTPGPAPPVDPSQLQPAQAGEWAEEVFNTMVNSDDEILHATLYQWLIDNRYTDRLLNIKSPFLESYLKRGISQHPDQLHLFDIIWKYYEKNGEYLLAAKILDKLSGRHSTELNLKNRVEYLSRAIMCVKSVEGENSRGIGQLSTELEEKMEVARVQLMVLEAAANIPAASGSLNRLNCDLLDITTLYQDWAEPFQLWECKLAILATAGHPDPMLIQNIWTNIIDRQLDRLAHSDVTTKKRAICCKIESLGRLYSSSSKYFPLEFLVRKLELFSCTAGGGEYMWVPDCLQKIGVDLPRLLDVYNRIYLAKEAMWLTAGNELHILHVLASILTMFVEAPLSVTSNADRRQFTVVCQDAVSAYLGELYMKQTDDTASMISRFRDIQARLDRLKY